MSNKKLSKCNAVVTERLEKNFVELNKLLTKVDYKEPKYEKFPERCAGAIDDDANKENCLGCPKTNLDNFFNELNYIPIDEQQNTNQTKPFEKEYHGKLLSKFTGGKNSRSNSVPDLHKITATTHHNDIEVDMVAFEKIVAIEIPNLDGLEARLDTKYKKFEIACSTLDEYLHGLQKHVPKGDQILTLDMHSEFGKTVKMLNEKIVKHLYFIHKKSLDHVENIEKVREIFTNANKMNENFPLREEIDEIYRKICN